jgi:hypothetical protein
MMNKFLMIGFLLFCSSVSSYAFAAQVIKVKGTKVGINLDGLEVAIGDQFILINDRDKKVGLIKIIFLKDGKAIGEILKGKSFGNERLTPFSRSNPSGPLPMPPALLTKKEKSFRNDHMIFSLGYYIDQFNITLSDGTSDESIKTTGSTIGFNAAYDYQLSPSFSLLASAGYQPFHTQGEASIFGCGDQDTTTCTTDIKYLALGVMPRFNYNFSKLNLWVGAGGAFMIPISKTSNAVTAESIGINLIYSMSLGFDYYYSSKYFFPVSLTKDFYPKAKINSMDVTSLKFGFGYNF